MICQQNQGGVAKKVTASKDFFGPSGSIETVDKGVHMSNVDNRRLQFFFAGGCRKLVDQCTLFSLTIFNSCSVLNFPSCP